MEKILGVFIVGEPKAQPRAKASTFRNAGFVRMYDPGTANEWKRLIKLAVCDGKTSAAPHSTPLRIDLTFHFPRPQYMCTAKWPEGPIWHEKKPDRDNLEKAVLDALKDCSFLSDDCIVCAGTIAKLYSAKNGKPGVHLRVYKLSDEDLPK